MVRIIKKILGPRLFIKIKDFLLKDEETPELIIPINCVIFLPESILEPFHIDRLTGLKHSSSKSVFFLHDAFPITHPKLVNDETRIRAAAIMTMLQVSDLISCQTESVLEVANSLLKAAYSLDSNPSYPRLACHRRPILLSKVSNDVAPVNPKFDVLRDTGPDFEVLKAAGLMEKEYVLTLGTIEPRKDHLSLFLACKTLWHKGLDFKLVVVGQWGWNYESIKRVSNHLINQGHDITILNDVSDAQVQSVIKYCQVFVFPSIAEGVGLPPGEALFYSKKPICRKIPSLVETFSDDCLTFFDGSIEDLARKIEIELNTPTMPSVPGNVREQSWEQMIHQILSDLEKIK
jgi:glycosyltransferase involved in cell wall biosynthesis